MANPNYNMQYTYSQGIQPSMAIQYFERTLLENMQAELIHSRDGQKRTLPLNNGKTVNFRRFTPFAAITDPLVEGVTPDGQSLEETAFTAMVKPYGGYVSMTDEFNLYALDNLTQETAKLLSDQANLSLDTISRDALHAGMNVTFAGGKTARSALTAADVLTGAIIKKTVRNMKRKNVKPFADGYYHAIVHPDTVFDLTSDPMWLDIAKYQDKQKVEKYELGTMYGVKFYESTNAKTFTTAGQSLYKSSTTGAAVTEIVASANYDAATRTLTTALTMTADDARALTGKLVDVTFGSNRATVCVERVDYQLGKIVLRWNPANTSAMTTANSLKIVPTGAGASGAEVYSTIVYGADAFGTIELGGNGQNVSVIIKEPGSSGVLDPLNQRGSIGWRVKGFCTVILQDDFICRIEHGATA